MRRNIVVFTWGMAFLVLYSGIAFAQATAQISGTVRDQSGGVLPGVTITATQQETGVVRGTNVERIWRVLVTESAVGAMERRSHACRIQHLHSDGRCPAGRQQRRRESTDGRRHPYGTGIGHGHCPYGRHADGRRRYRRREPAHRRITAQRARSDAVGHDLRRGRANGHRRGRGRYEDRRIISVAGGGDNGVWYYLDGAPHIDNLSGSGLHLPFPDALQEFRLTTGAQEAGANIRAAASVSAVTKAGTNVLHGGAFEFLRDSRFNEPDPISGVKDALKRNQFGGTVGGPMVRDRLFFFAGLQATTTRQNPLNQTSFVPTAAMIAGDFRAFASPACNNGRQLTLGGGFVNNMIDPSRLSPAALNIARRLPTPVDDCGRVLWGEPNNRDEYQVPIRVDYQANNAHAFVLRYMLTTDDRKMPLDEANGNLLATSNPEANDRAHNITGGHTWVVNSTMVNSFRAFGNVVNAFKPGPQYFFAEGRRHQCLHGRPRNDLPLSARQLHGRAGLVRRGHHRPPQCGNQ